jgi:beta-phosphoglucomutase-like phosphatase (HAD superfamily)
MPVQSVRSRRPGLAAAIVVAVAVLSALFHEADRRLGVRPEHAVVIEDALAGVEAGRHGGFGMVIGVDRTGHPRNLLEHGADVVVTDLAEVHLPAATGREGTAGG